MQRSGSNLPNQTANIIDCFLMYRLSKLYKYISIKIAKRRREEFILVGTNGPSQLPTPPAVRVRNENEIQ